MKNKLLERNIQLEYMRSFLSEMAFYLPIMVLFFNQIVDSVTLVALLFSIQAIAILVLDVPSSAFADLFGRKNSLVLAGVISLVGITLLAFSTNFIMLIVYCVLFAIAQALTSGTQQAIAYESLKELGREKEYKKLLGRWHVLTMLGGMIGAIAGGLMAGYDLRLPFLLSIPLSLIYLISFILMAEPKYEKASHYSPVKHICDASRIVISNGQLLILFCFSLLSFGVAEATWQLNQIFLQYVQLPVSYFGIAFAIASMLGLLGAWFSHVLAEKFGDRNVLIVSKLFDGVFLALAALFLGYLGVFFVILTSFFRSVASPILSHLIMDKTESKNRATLLSLNSLMMNAGLAIFAPLLGYVADFYSIAISFIISGCLLALSVTLLLFLRNQDDIKKFQL